MELIYPKESNMLQKLALQLHNELGCGFKEKVYQDTFEILLKENNIPYVREKHIALTFHGVSLSHDFFYDFLCWDKIGIELKAMPEIIGEFESQVINYLHVSNHQLGVIFNFGAKSLQYKWIPNKWDYRECAEINNSQIN